jgi:hypothetical protein
MAAKAIMSCGMTPSSLFHRRQNHDVVQIIIAVEIEVHG